MSRIAFIMLYQELVVWKPDAEQTAFRESVEETVAAHELSFGPPV